MSAADVTRVLVACRDVCGQRLVDHYRGAGVETVAAFSTADADAAWVEAADYQAWIGDGDEAWRDAQRIVGAAMDAGCDAVHPGDGPAALELDLVSLATAANLAVIGVDPKRAAEVLDRSRVAAVARRAGLEVPPIELVSGDDDGVEAAARLGLPLVAAAATGGAEARIAGFDELPAALARVGRPAVLARSADADVVEVVVVGERGGRARALVELRAGPRWETVEGRSEGRMAAAERLAVALGFVGVGVVRFLLLPGSAWFAGFEPRLPAAWALVERAADVDLVDVQHRLTVDGALGGITLGAPRAGAMVVVRATGPGRVGEVALPEGARAGVGRGEEVAAGRAIAHVVGVGPDLAAARADLARALASARVAGVGTDLDALRAGLG